MNEFPESELIRRLERLGAVEPASTATNRAVEQVRRALAEAPALPSHSRRSAMTKRFLAAAAVLLVVSGLGGLGGLVVWLLSGTAPIAFSEVQAAVKASGSMTCRQLTKINGKVKETTTLQILANGIARAEEEDGGYTITDPVNHRALFVRPESKEAVLIEGMNTPPINLYELIKKLPNDAAAQPLPRKKLDGKDVLGFMVPAPCDSGYCKGEKLTLTVWADAGTRLPVRIETGDKDEKGDLIETIVDQIVFDKALDEKLFLLEPPDGYKLRTEGVANFPAPPADPKLKDLVVTLREGIGDVKFFMAREEVEKALGKADEVKEFAKNVVLMNYGSRGLFIQVSKTRGVIAITCTCQQMNFNRIRDFSGKTNKGIAMGASAADVIKAYGEPSRKDSNEKDGGQTTLYYDKLFAWFSFRDDKLLEIFLRFPR